MLRWLAICAVVCCGAFALVTYWANPSTSHGASASDDSSRSKTPGGRTGGDARSGDKGVVDVTVEVNPRPALAVNRPVIVAGCRLVSPDHQDVPSERDGQLLVIGTEIRPGEVVPEEKRYQAIVGFLIVPDQARDNTPESQKIRFKDNPSMVFRPWREGDPYEPGKIRLHRVYKDYKRLEVGDEVAAGQTVALVDPVLALHDSQIKIAAIDSAESERKAAYYTKEESKRRYEGILYANSKVPNTVSKDDEKAMYLNILKYGEEEVKAASSLIKSQAELAQSLAIVNKHEIHATISGVIKSINKHRGEAVKALETVLQIQSPDVLKVEGVVDIQDAQRLAVGNEVTVEATREESPRVLKGHLKEVNAVAVSRGPKSIVVSGCQDGIARFWDPVTGDWLWQLNLKSPVRALTCTGAKANANLVLIGTGDGTVRILDLAKPPASQKTRELESRLSGAVLCVAFSVDGSLCAAAGEDRQIHMWNVATGKKYPAVAAHLAPVTSLQFTVRNQLVSAARDGSLIVFNADATKGLVEENRLTGRGKDVAQLGVSPDGNRVLFDQGKEIRILSLEKDRFGQIDGVLQNVGSAANFTTAALFDPDGLTILTNASSEGRVQLWRTPSGSGARGAELRQFEWKSGAVNCAAFSPDSSFAVMGTLDQKVLVWKLPERETVGGKIELVEKPVKARLAGVGKIIEANRQVPVWVYIDNKDRRYVPGNFATLVVTPNEGK